METLVSMPLYPRDGVRMLMASIDSVLRVERVARPVTVDRGSRGNRMRASVDGRLGPHGMSITVHEQPLAGSVDVGLWRTPTTEEGLRQDAKAFQSTRPWLSDADALAVAVETELEVEALYAEYPQTSEVLIRIVTPAIGGVVPGNEIEFDHWNVLRLIADLHGRDKLDLTGTEFRYLDGKWYPLEETSVYAITQVRGLAEYEGDVHANLLDAAGRRSEWAALL